MSPMKLNLDETCGRIHVVTLPLHMCAPPQETFRLLQNRSTVIPIRIHSPL